MVTRSHAVHGQHSHPRVVDSCPCGESKLENPLTPQSREPMLRGRRGRPSRFRGNTLLVQENILFVRYSQTLRENLCIQLQLPFREELKDINWNVLQHSLGSSSSQLFQRVLIPKRQKRSHQLLTGSRHLPRPFRCSSLLLVLWDFERCQFSPTTLLIILKPVRNSLLPTDQRLGVCATTWTGSKRTISMLGSLLQRRRPSFAWRRSLNAIEKA